jgi:hypothetical protein
MAAQPDNDAVPNAHAVSNQIVAQRRLIGFTLGRSVITSV